MLITRLYADSDGNSCFETVDVPLSDAGRVGHLSERIPATAVILRETDGEYDYDFHNAPERQLIVMLEGAVDIETSLGDVRRFSTGDIVLAEDVDGAGHRARAVEGQPRRSLFIPVGEADLPL